MLLMVLLWHTLLEMAHLKSMTLRELDGSVPLCHAFQQTLAKPQYKQFHNLKTIILQYTKVTHITWHIGTLYYN